MITAGASKLRAAEKAAKAHRRCVWRDYVAPPPNPNSLVGKNFVGVVVEAASGDSIVVADAETGRGATGDAVLDPRPEARQRATRDQARAVGARGEGVSPREVRG